MKKEYNDFDQAWDQFKISIYELFKVKHICDFLLKLITR